MLRLAFLLVLSLTLQALAGCSDVGSTPDPSAGGTGGDGGEWFMDPPAQTGGLTLGCTNNLTSEIRIVRWDLTVDPGPIVAGRAFGAVLSGLMVFNEELLDEAQAFVPGGYKRSNLLGVQATVHVRSGVAADAMDVVLTNEPMQRSCTYDESGDIGPDAGPFSLCYEANDNPDGSNEDCTGLGGMPDPQNPCGQFITLRTSKQCGPGELCESKGKTGPGSQCDLNGFCVSDQLEVRLQAAHVQGYLAADSGAVLFGWDDESTGAYIDQSGGPNRETVILPPTIADDPGPNSFRATIGAGILAALDCTMAEGTRTALTRTPESELISFSIQQP